MELNFLAKLGANVTLIETISVDMSMGNRGKYKQTKTRS